MGSSIDDDITRWSHKKQARMFAVIISHLLMERGGEFKISLRDMEKVHADIGFATDDGIFTAAVNMDDVPERLRVPCTCGSGGHPRHCKRHPDAFEAHVMEMNRDLALEDELDKAKEKLDACQAAWLKVSQEFGSDEPMSCASIVAGIKLLRKRAGEE